MRAAKLMLAAPTFMVVMLCLLVSIFLNSTVASTAHAAQTIPYKINFQGRLTDATGNIKPDGTYNMRIRIYDSLTGGTLQWTGDRSYTGTGTADHRVTVTNGLFSVQLGDTAVGVGDPALPPSLFNTQTYAGLYIEVELASAATATSTAPTWSEGPMSPRSQLGAAPYAFNSDTIDGIDGSSLARVDASNTFASSNTFNGTNTFNAANTYSSTNTFNGRVTLQNADINLMTNSYLAFNQYYNGTSYVLQDAGGGAQILNNPATGLKINVTAPKASGAAAVNGDALIIKAANDNIRATTDVGVNYGENLISNPGYEFGCIGWDSATNCTGDTVNPRTGLQAGMYTQATATTSNYSNSRFASVHPGDIMYAQGYIRSSVTTNGSAAVGINFFDKNGTYIPSSGVYSTSTNPGTTYALRTVQATVPANAVYATALAAFFGDGTAGGSWYFDDMEMYPVTQSAPVNFKNDANSTTAFQIQDASSNQLFIADTTGNAILIGSGDVSPSAAPTLLVLDNKNTTGDPAGRAGAMYYNSASGKFRCYEAGTWKDCVGQNARNSYYYNNDFMSGLTPTTGSALDGTLSPGFAGTAAAITPQSGVVNHPGISRMGTGSTATAIAGYINNSSGAASVPVLFGGGNAWSSVASVRTPTLSVAAQTFTTRVGFINQNSTGTATNNGCFLSYTHGTNSGKWQGNCINAGTASVCDTGMAVVAGNWNTLTVTVNAAANSVTFTVDDTTAGTSSSCAAPITTNIPTANNTGFGVQIQKTVGTTASVFDVDYLQVVANSMTR